MSTYVLTTSVLPKAQFGYTIRPTYATIRSGITEYDFVQRRNKSAYGARHIIEIKPTYMTPSQESTLYGFFCSRRGGWESFLFYDMDPSTGKTWSDVYVGTGDGASTSFALRGKDCTSISVTQGGSALSTGWARATAAPGSTNGMDVLNFSSNAPSGVLKVSYKGKRCFNVVFNESNIDRTVFLRDLYETGFSLIEVST